jgi:Kef-type K+ transport system membrane component KefB
MAKPSSWLLILICLHGPMNIAVLPVTVWERRQTLSNSLIVCVRFGRELYILGFLQIFWMGFMFKARFRGGVTALKCAFAATFLLAPSLALAAGGELPPLVHDIGIALFLSGFLAILFARIKFPAIAGYILGGIIAGPLALGLVTDPANVDTIAQLGFVFLLFVLGLEIDLSKIKKSGRTIIASGLVSVPLIALFGFAAAKLLALIGFGAIINENLGALYIGLAISVSSTLLVVKLFQEAFELDTVPGRLALGILVMEDLWAIIIILLQPSLENPQPLAILASFGGIALLAGVAFVLSRNIIPLAFRWIAKTPEIILVGALAWCFSIVFLGSTFDAITMAMIGKNFHINVGPGMSALIAGATIATLPYSTEIITKVNVVKDFFLVLFFVSLGLSIPAPSGANVFVLAIAIAAVAIIARQLILFPLLYFTGADRRNAEVTAVRMAQISEFSLVVIFLGLTLGHLSADLATAIILAFVLTALTTAPFYHYAYDIHTWVSPLLHKLGFRSPTRSDNEDEREWRLAILGFHRVASSLLHDIARDDPPLLKDTLVVDFAVNLHDKIRKFGAHVEYGDLSNPDTLHHAGVDRAEVVISTVSDDIMRGINNAELVASVRKINPNALIIANAVNLADVETIYSAGANYVFVSRLDSATALGEAIEYALNGTLAEYRNIREKQHGKPSERWEVLP